MTGPDDISATYAYNSLNQISSITDMYDNAANYYYDDGGRLTLRTYANGSKAEFAYDDANRLTKLANKEYNDTVISSFEYAYDKAGARTQLMTPDETIKYTYDNISQVTEVYSVTDQLVLEEFAYDAAGNRTSDVDDNTYTYNDNNQLTSINSGDVDLYYDDNGNLTKRTVGVADTTYTYNQENQLVRIDYPNQEYSTYKYDAFGRRIEKRNRAGNIKRFYYDGFDLVAGYDGSNNLTANATFGPGIDNPISLNYDGDIYYYHTDALGSVTEMTDENEDVAQSYEYSAFGEILTQSGSLTYINPFTYTARELDNESGLYYYRYRYYSADIGRFITYDPVYWGGGINLYVYVGNSSISNADPFGLMSGKNRVVQQGFYGPLQKLWDYSSAKGKAIALRSWAAFVSADALAQHGIAAAGYFASGLPDGPVYVPATPYTPPGDYAAPLQILSAMADTFEERADNNDIWVDELREEANKVDPDYCPTSE